MLEQKLNERQHLVEVKAISKLRRREAPQFVFGCDHSLLEVIPLIKSIAGVDSMINGENNSCEDRRSHSEPSRSHTRRANQCAGVAEHLRCSPLQPSDRSW